MLAVKPLLYIIGGLVIALGASNMRSCSLKKDVEKAQAKVTAVETERDAFKLRVENDTKTIAAYKKALVLSQGAVADLRALYEECYATKQAQERQAEAAIQRLDASLRDANATLAGITARFKAATRDPECAVANRPICDALRSD